MSSEGSIRFTVEFDAKSWARLNRLRELMAKKLGEPVSRDWALRSSVDIAEARLSVERGDDGGGG